MTETQQLQASIASLQAQRALLGDAVVDTALAAMQARLQALQAQNRDPAQTLRQVSVLFLDMVDSTALAAQLDPEAVHAVMDDTLKACSEIVRAHGGTVLQYAGDSLLAAFGTPQAREDDAERAVRCGLALLPLGEALGRRVQQQHGLAGGQVRVGIHTGPVLLGGGVDEAGTIRGVTVNLAARMEQTAPPGALRISQATWRLVRGAFDMAEQPPLHVKGQTEALRTWLVQAVRPRSFRVPARGIDGLETAMVGRSDELARLLAAFEQVLQTRQPRACTVIADAGLGKSRLLHELQHALDSHPQPFWLLLGRATPGGMLQPYGVLREMLAWRLQIADSDSAETARRKLVDGLLPWLTPQPLPAGPGAAAAPDDAAAPPGRAHQGTTPAEAGLQAELLGQLIGMDFSSNPEVATLLATPRQLRDRGLEAFGLWLRAMAARSGQPVVMLLDDLQWADDASLDALAPLLGAPGGTGLPVLTVMAARPSLLERRTDWGGHAAAHQILHLHELAGSAQAELTSQLLARLDEPPAPLLALIEQHAAGNPFYAEELVKMLIDDGVIEVGAEGWTMHASRLKPDQVPATLTGVLQARLDALDPGERKALQWASVVGAVFWDEALGSLDPAAPNALPTLQQRALVHAHPESLYAGTHEQAFQHHLLHQVTYETVLKAERQIGHARAAEWLAARVGERSAEYMAVVAEHHERAGDAARAFEWYERATFEAAKRFAQTAVLAHGRKALALPPPADLKRLWKVLVKLGFACDVLGLRDEQAQVLVHKLALATQLGDETMRAAVLSGQALLADRVGDYDRAGSLAREGVALAERVGSFSDAALCWGELAWLSYLRNDLGTALRETEAGLVWARRARDATPSDPIYEMQLLVLLAYLQGALHQRAEQRQTLMASLALARARQEVRAESSCHLALAEVALALADATEAEQHAQALRQCAEKAGYTVQLAGYHLINAQIAQLQGDPARALQQAEQGYALYERIGSRNNQGLVRLSQAESYMLQEQPAQALTCLQEALALLQAVEALPEARVCNLLMAQAHGMLGQMPQAQQLLAAEWPACDEPGALGVTGWALKGRVAAWQALQAAGDPRAAQQLALARQELLRRVDPIADPEVRARVLQRVALHRQIADGCRAAGLPLD